MALFIIGVILGGAIGYACTYFTAPKTTEYKYRLEGEIPIGAIMSSSEWCWREDPYAIRIAEEEINAYLENLGYPVRFVFLIENAEGSPAKALEKLTALAAKGCKVVIGLRFSSHIQAIKGYADEHHIVIISSGSSSPLLAIPGDFIFRLPCTDAVTFKALRRYILDTGLKALIVMQRGDAWGDALFEEAKKIEDEGIVIYDHIRYDPEAKEFSAEVGRMAEKVHEAIEKYGEDKVGVVSFSFLELSTILAQAASYPELLSVPWMGNDNKAGIETEVGEYLVMTKAIFPMFTVPQTTSLWKKFASEFLKRSGLPAPAYPTAYNAMAYDAAWLAAKAVLEAGVYDGDVIKEVLPKVAERYFGASGLCTLNANGDRDVMDYEIWAVVKEDGNYVWKVVGYYNSITDAITWY
ncbi:MAG: ABC transporter substrate-binding protein [Conexivisphaerales archaeon]